MSKPTLYIFAGANGCGKTTIAKRITKELEISFINADEIAAKLSGQSNTTAGRVFFKDFETKVEEGVSFAIESTLSGKTIVQRIQSARHRGFEVFIVYLFLNSPKTNIERVNERVKMNGHFVPHEDIIRRFYRSKKQFWKTYRFLCDAWVLLYNPSDSLTTVANGNNLTKELKVLNQNLMNDFLDQVNL